jgi:hypothetical protein
VKNQLTRREERVVVAFDETLQLEAQNEIRITVRI